VVAAIAVRAVIMAAAAAAAVVVAGVIATDPRSFGGRRSDGSRPAFDFLFTSQKFHGRTH
jgi:hypothetical protein